MNVVLIFSDYGVSLGEHGYTGKLARAIWPELSDIVFYVRHPEGKGAGKTSDYRASVHDVAPTILGTLGIDSPSPMEGQDLSAILDGKEPEQKRPDVTLGYDDYSWAQDGRWALSVRNDARKRGSSSSKRTPGWTATSRTGGETWRDACTRST